MIFNKTLSSIPEMRVVHPKLEGEDTIQLFNILDAYKDLKKIYVGAHQVVRMFDGIADKCYTLTECIYAGIILTDGLDGIYSDKRFHGEGKYIRINNHDFVIIGEETILTESIFDKNAVFYTKNGKTYRLKKR